MIGVELTDEAVERGRGHLSHSTGRAVARGKMSEADQAEILGRISFATDLSALAEADFVVEAVIESLDIKKDLFRRLDDIVKPDAILATNTSSLPVTEIATANTRPGRVVGVHFFNPAPVQNLVEIVRTVVTEPAVLADVEGLVGTLGKNPVVCGDKAGFIANTLLFGYLNHAASMFESKYATREDIDAAMRFGCGYPMGPLALLDLIGLDTAYEILDTMYKQGRDRLHAPAPILKQMVTAGLLGRKTGRGFYTYESQDSSGRRRRRAHPVRRRPARSSSARSRPSASSAPAPWPPASSRSSPRAASTSCTSDARPTRSRECAPRSRSRWTRRSSAASSRRPTKAEVLGRLTGIDVARRPGQGRPRGRGDRRGPADQDHALREPRRDLQARRDPGHDHLLAAGDLAGEGDEPSAGRRSACTSSTRRRS